jgi:hypothetical protein
MSKKILKNLTSEICEPWDWPSRAMAAFHVETCVYAIIIGRKTARVEARLQLVQHNIAAQHQSSGGLAVPAPRLCAIP